MKSRLDEVTPSGLGSEVRARAELSALLLLGLGHALLELLWNEQSALVFTALGVLGFAAYVVARARRNPALLRRWGLRTDNFRSALPAHLGFALLGSAGLVGLGAFLRPLETPPTFWILLALYPLWGGAQQFALQNFVGANVARLLRSELGVAVVTGLLFGLSHVPRWDLTLLTLTSGIAFTLIYRRYPNLWAVALSHGVLGTLAIHFVAGEDPLRALMGG
ncbi:MAG: CPBP family intramembrane glutamic endopeptidase [Acidobacteriota bacterium]